MNEILVWCESMSALSHEGGQDESDVLSLSNTLYRTNTISRKKDSESNLGIPSVNIDFH